MSDNNKLLSAALIAFGAAFCLIYPLAMFCENIRWFCSGGDSRLRLVLLAR